MRNTEYQAYLQQLFIDRDMAALDTENNKGSSVGFDPLGVSGFFDKIGQNIVSILVIGLGMALVVVAGQGYVTGSAMRLQWPGRK